MILKIALFCVSSLLVGCGATTGSTRETPTADKVQIQTLLNKQVAAWNAGDIHAFMNGYEKSEKLVFTSGAVIRRGWKETLEKYKIRYGDNPQTMGTLAFSLDETRLVGNRAAVILGHWSLTGGEADGASGVFSLVLERQDGSWRIIHDHTSSKVQE